MRTHRLKAVLKRRFELLEMLAARVEDPWVAVVGLGTGIELYALTRGVRRACRSKRGDPNSPEGRVHVFHWNDLEHRRMREKLTSIDLRRARGGFKRKMPRFTIWEVVRWHIARDGTRDAWESAVEMLTAKHAALRFGLVCHLGMGRDRDIWGDLDVLTPLLDDRTILALCNVGRRSPKRHWERMTRRQGWHSVITGDTALLQRHALPLEES